MIINRRFCLFFAAVLFLGTQVFAVPLESLLPDNLVKQLIQSESVNRERYDITTLNMVPQYEALQRILKAKQSGFAPNISIESLRLYKKPSSGSWTAAQRAELFNGIAAVSTLKGLEYYSKRRSQMRVLYETSSVIDGPESKNARPDPVHQSPPSELSFYVRQRDGTFGDNVYQYTYYSDASSFIVFQENVSTLNYGAVPVASKGCLKAVVAVIDSGPYLLIYAASLAKSSMLPGMKQRAGESISNRAIALLSWFSRKADKVFGKTT